MRRLILPLGALALLIIGLGGGYVAGHFLRPPARDTPPAEAVSSAKAAPNPDLLYDLPDMLVALAGSNGQGKVLTLSISLQCPSQDDLGDLQEYLPRVLDAFQDYLRTLSVADLRGTKNLAILRVQLSQRANAVIAPGHVSAVLFRSLTIR